MLWILIFLNFVSSAGSSRKGVSSNSGSSKSSSKRREEEKSSGSSSSSRNPKKETSTSQPSNMKPVKEDPEELRGFFDDEPELDQGIFSALRLAQKKGYVQEQKEIEVCLPFCLWQTAFWFSH